MMKMICLKKADRVSTEFRGERFEFEKNYPREVDAEVADKMLKTGLFIHVVTPADMRRITEDYTRERREKDGAAPRRGKQAR